MGIYLNPGNENFKDMLKRDIYVDKTMMISVINHFIDTDNKYVCVSRPRRFGKTMTGNMLAAYYSKGCDSRELFAKYKIAEDASFEAKLNQYNVIKIDMNSEYQNATEPDNILHILMGEINSELQEAYPDVGIRPDDSPARNILRIYSATGETFIIIMDEYDVLVREQVNPDLFSEYLGFMNGLFKSDTLRPAITMAYLTGILPIVRDKIQSKLNNFEEYTILDAGELAEYVGFTDGEVRDLCEKYDMDYDECRLWYDGYRQYGFDIYNPESVIKSIRKKRFDSYWSGTSTYEAIAELIRLDFKGTREDVLRMLSGESIDVNVTRFRNTLDSFSTRGEIFTYLIHLGYLSYDLDNRTCRIPNKEVNGEWQNAIETESGYEMTTRIVQASKELLAATIAGNEEMVARALDESHIHVTSNRSYNNEDALQSAIYLAYIYALNEYTIVREMTSGKGFADVTFIPVKPDKSALIIELKRNGSADSAIEQIHDKQYFDSLSHYQGNLIFVGINYDEETKTHTCRIERMVL